MKWTDTDLAYLAGFIDGEGSISIFTSVKARRDNLRFDIYNTDEGILRWIEQVFGGRIHIVRRARDGWKQEFTWTCGQQHAASVLTACLPYLKVKRRQAELFVQHQATSKRNGVGWKWTPPEILAVRAAIVAEMGALNRRGRIEG